MSRTESNEKSGTYLQKKEEKKIRTFLQKKYDEDTIKQVKLEIKNIETFLKKSNFNIQKNYSKYPPEIKKYINPIDISDEDYIRCEMTPTSVGGEQQISISGGSQSPI
ncbi:hypothetical protein [Blautia sp. HCP28S3_G10]|uniref:hypothetical protein n=1 Tax=Blautia sp. HCP28S3_G10 TaxID=3438908 RepID=UPI003F8BC012